MDSGHIVQALSMPLFKKHFLGFLFSDVLSLPRKEHKYLDFSYHNHVFGEHWFISIRGRTKWIIFDCSVFTPKEYHDVLKEILSRKTPVVFGCSQLQRPTSLSYGPHVLSIFVLFSYNTNETKLFLPCKFLFQKIT